MRDHRSTGAASQGRSTSAGHLMGAALGLLILMLVIAAPVIAAKPVPGPATLNPLTIPKYVNQLDGPPPVYVPVSENSYEVTATEFQQQILPAPLPMTTVWGYGGHAKDAVTGAPLGVVSNSPGPSFNVTRGTTTTVNWVNQLTNPHLFPVDPTLHWANPNGMATPTAPFLPFPTGYPDAQTNVPMVVHVHGAEVQSASDGYPEAWWTATGFQGPDYSSPGGLTTANAAKFVYPNSQQPGTIWYHDHALGVTRTNVMSGLAGFYFIRDPADPIEPLLPQGEYEMPLAIQDRTFNPDGSFFFPTVGLDPAAHPYWNPEFFGDTIMVNGKVWPNMNVKQGTYRFHLLDGSNARFYTLSFSNKKLGMTQIGTDGGYLKTAAPLKELTMAPGERADILVDFSALPIGTTVILQNTAKAPFPAGTNANPQTTGQIMQFTVTGPGASPFPVLPAVLNPTLAGATFPNLPAPTTTRILTLQEVMGALGPTEILLDGKMWDSPVSETPTNGATEEWVIVNPTADTHPIHLHLVQFQLVSRQAFQVKKYQTAWMAAQGGMMPPFMNEVVTPVDPTPYLQGKASGPRTSELGWKDTVQMNPGEVTRLRVRFAAQDGTAFPFDPTTSPGYVWHCHILDHEDNEMMRPYTVI